MPYTYKSTDKLLQDYNYLSQSRKAKLDNYLRNLYRLEQAERRVNWAETDVEREIRKVGLADHGGKIRCSFCGRSQDDATKLIAGPDVYICDECIELCGEILREETGNPEE